MLHMAILSSACAPPSTSRTGSRQARTRAAEEGTTLTALLTEGLRLRLGEHAERAPAPAQAPDVAVGGGLQPWIDPSSNASLLDPADDGAAP